MSYHLVISRYAEKLDWIQSIPKENVIIYNKGLDFETDFTVKRLPNVGRESHTYLSYIIEHYDSLPDVVIFSQGGFDHFANHGIVSKNEFGYNVKIEQLVNIKSYSTNFVLAGFNNGLQNYRLFKWGDDLTPLVIDNKTYSGKTWFNEFINTDINLDVIRYPIWWGACFSVRKECILSRSKEFYQTLLSHLEETRNPESGHYFERAWFFIFNLNSPRFPVV